MKSHKDLNVYSESMDLVVEIYKLTKVLPDEEKFGLVSQMRRAAVSVPSNIAEGASRSHPKEMVRFLYFSLGSASELETHIEIVRRLGFVEDSTEDILKRLFYIKRMLIKLIESLNKKIDS